MQPRVAVHRLSLKRSRTRQRSHTRAENAGPLIGNHILALNPSLGRYTPYPNTNRAAELQ